MFSLNFTTQINAGANAQICGYVPKYVLEFMSVYYCASSVYLRYYDSDSDNLLAIFNKLMWESDG